MRRVLSVYLPQWPTERVARRLKLPSRQAILIVATKGGRQLVMHACPNALRAGVAPGMDLAHARALITADGPVAAPHQPGHDSAALEALARWATRWSPIVSADQPDGLLLDITGCGHLFGGERALASSLRTRLRAVGFSARAAVASTVGAAWGLARYGRRFGIVVEAGQERETLAPLPVQALRLPANVVEALNEVGVEHVGQLLDLPRSMLPARYGAELVLRLDQAFGAVHEQIFGAPESTPLRSLLELPGGTTQWEAVASAARLLLTELVGQLEQRDCGLRRLDATFRRLDSAELCIVVQVGRPTRSAEHLWSLVRPKLERLNLGHGVTGIVLNAVRVAPLAHHQGSFLDEPGDSHSDDAAIDQTIDAIANRIGPERVCRFSLRESHRPEVAAAVVPVLDGSARTPVRLPQPRPRVRERPSGLLALPEPVRVIALSPDGPLMSVMRGGRDRRVVASVGPERIGGQWWRAREPVRDYFRVQEESGRWLWVFRDVNSGGWFVHGEWA